MDLSALYRFKDNQAKWIYPAFYLAAALLIASVFCYLVFATKVYLQEQKVAELNRKLAVYGTAQEKLSESKFIDYKKKIEYFSSMIAAHKNSLNAFDFLEEKTMPTIWFSSIDILQVKNQISLSGEAKNLEELSRQIKLFEESNDQVKSVTVLSSKTGNDGKVQFTLGLSIYPKLFLKEPQEVQAPQQSVPQL